MTPSSSDIPKGSNPKHYIINPAKRAADPKVSNISFLPSSKSLNWKSIVTGQSKVEEIRKLRYYEPIQLEEQLVASIEEEDLLEV